VGIYFSLSDWSHPDYPAFTEEMKPYVFLQSPPRPEPERWPRFLDCLFGQIRELLGNYGPIDLLWFDGGWERRAEEWRAGELAAMEPDRQRRDPGRAARATGRDRRLDGAERREHP